MLKQWSRKSLAIAGVVTFIAAFALLQFANFLPGFERTNPPVTQQIDWNSPETETLVRAACYDCHSNETTWPWYTYVAPSSLLVTHDVNEGREKMNFSTGHEVELREILEVLRESEMPPQTYTIMHPEAKLSAEEKTALIDGLTQSLSGRSG